MTIYLGMVTLYNAKGRGSDNISFAGFNKETVKRELVKIAGDVLKSFTNVYKVESDELDPEAIVLVCDVYPRKIRYWIREVETIDKGP